MSDYERLEDELRADGPKQVMVAKRYDDHGGAWMVNILTYPRITDEEGWELPNFFGFLDDHIQFGIDLEAHGYICEPWADMPEEFKDWTTYHILPREWHGAMDELGDRVTVYHNDYRRKDNK